MKNKSEIISSYYFPRILLILLLALFFVANILTKKYLNTHSFFGVGIFTINIYSLIYLILLIFTCVFFIRKTSFYESEIVSKYLFNFNVKSYKYDKINVVKFSVIASSDITLILQYEEKKSASFIIFWYYKISKNIEDSKGKKCRSYYSKRLGVNIFV